MKNSSLIRNRAFIINSSIAVILLIIPFVLYYFFPVAYLHLIFEDSVGENVTAIGYLIAAAVMVFALVQNRNKSKIFTVLIALFFIFMGLEEISYGQRIFGFETPENMYLVNAQREFNFHNLSFVANLNIALTWAIILWVFLLPVLIRKNELIRNLVKQFDVPIVQSTVTPLFAVPMFFHIIIRLLPVIDEIKESYFAIAFIGFAVSFAMDSQISRKKEAVFFRPFVSVLGLVTLISIMLAVYFPNDNDLVRRGIQLASRYYPTTGPLQNSDRLYTYMLHHKRLILNNETGIRYAYAVYLIETKNDNDAAIEQFERTIAVEKQKSVSKEQEVDRHIFLATVYNYMGDNDKTRLEYESAINKSLDNLTRTSGRMEKYIIHMDLAYLYNTLGDYHNTLINLKEAKKLCANRSEEKEFMKKVLSTIL